MDCPFSFSQAPDLQKPISLTYLLVHSLILLFFRLYLFDTVWLVPQCVWSQQVKLNLFKRDPYYVEKNPFFKPHCYYNMASIRFICSQQKIALNDVVSFSHCEGLTEEKMVSNWLCQAWFIENSVLNGKVWYRVEKAYWFSMRGSHCWVNHIIHMILF